MAAVSVTGQTRLALEKKLILGGGGNAVVREKSKIKNILLNWLMHKAADRA